MTIRAEFEREKDGRWVAEIPGVPGALSYGSTRREAAIGVTACALRIIADRIENGELKVTDEPEMILVEEGSQLHNLLFEGGNIPNAETIAAIEELENGGGKSFEKVEALMAELNADD